MPNAVGPIFVAGRRVVLSALKKGLLGEPYMRARARVLRFAGRCVHAGAVP